MKEPVIVSIHCITYNHEPYIRQCLEGFVMQQTNFRFVAIVHDDASTDNTAAIIREYEEKYPDIIKPIYEIENQYSKGDGSLGRIMNDAIVATGAKYVAMCEGDDYWTDPLKLQKQVDFLEANEDYSICFCDAMEYYQDEKRFSESPVTGLNIPETTSILDLAKRSNYIHTPTVMYRYNPSVYEMQEHMFAIMGPVPAADYVSHMFYAKYGKIKRIQECMVVYRVHSGGIWSMQKYEILQFKWLKELYCLTPFFDDEIKYLLKEQFITSHNIVLYHMEKTNEFVEKIQSLLLYRCGISLIHFFTRIKSKVLKK